MAMARKNVDFDFSIAGESKVLVSFVGRERGALGITYKITGWITVNGITYENVQNAISGKYEPFHSMTVNGRKLNPKNKPILTRPYDSVHTAVFLR